jgi:ribosomal protein L31E
MTTGIRTPIRGMRWWRRRRFTKAYKIVRNEAERHKKAGHDVDFSAINEAWMKLECKNCPELLP